MNASRLRSMKPASASEIMIEQLLPQLRRQIGLGVVQERSNVVLQRALAPALIIEEKRLAVAQHDVSRLEIAIQKVIAGARSTRTLSSG